MQQPGPIIENPHALTENDIAEKLKTDTAKGLSGAEAEKRLQQYGRNILETQKPENLFKVILKQFISPIVGVLAVAAVLAFIFNQWLEGFAIIAVLLINAAIGFIMEWQAIRSMEALRKLATVEARVIRNGTQNKISSEEIVPGDLLYFEAGDVISADARLLKQVNLAIKESALTGESTQVEKQLEKLPPETTLADRKNMVFNGTTVTRGNGTAIVTGTGAATELGRIAEMTREAVKESTPLEKRLNKLSKKLIWLTLAIVVVMVVLGALRGNELVLLIESAIALAVAAIPEGLPIVATIALARGMLKLAKKNVVVKHLEAVQTLGETNIICTDKTGTLTENEMYVETVVLASENKEIDINNKAFELLAKVGVLCNNASYISEKDNKNNGSTSGDPVEIALLRLADEKGISAGKIKEQFTREAEIPFDSTIKMMGTLHHSQNGYLVCAKGALEAILEKCEYIFDENESNYKEFTDKEKWLQKADNLAADGLRILAFAYKKTEAREKDFLQGLVFLGIIGFLDPPREDVKPAIETCKKAGIKVVMVTGDHPGTALNIARQVGLAPTEGSLAVHGKDLVADDQELNEEYRKKLLEERVFARITPAQKLALISVYQQEGMIVGMTGDGVNDTPALKKADIGIAMGIRGTEAAKEVADLILKDDAFSSIVLAIKQGRIIFDNIRKFVVYLLSCNLSEIMVVGIASFGGLPLPLLPLQILFINLVTDVFPALALGMGKGCEDIMDVPPRNPTEHIITRSFWISIIVYSTGITAGVFSTLLYAHFLAGHHEMLVNNMAFYTLILAQLWNVFNIPSAKSSFFVNEVTSNKYIWGAIIISILIVVAAYFIPTMREVLSLQDISLLQLGFVLLFSFIPVALVQFLKRTGIIK